MDHYWFINDSCIATSIIYRFRQIYNRSISLDFIENKRQKIIDRHFLQVRESVSQLGGTFGMFGSNEPGTPDLFILPKTRLDIKS